MHESYHKVVDRFGRVYYRPNTLAGYVRFELEHFSPEWSPQYVRWLIRQARKLDLI